MASPYPHEPSLCVHDPDAIAEANRAARGEVADRIGGSDRVYVLVSFSPLPTSADVLVVLLTKKPVLVDAIGDRPDVVGCPAQESRTTPAAPPWSR